MEVEKVKIGEVGGEIMRLAVLHSQLALKEQLRDYYFKQAAFHMSQGEKLETEIRELNDVLVTRTSAD